MLPRILSILFADQVQWLYFVIVGQLNKLVFEVAQIHVSALFDNDFEIRIKRVEETPGHGFHLLVDRGTAHDQLLLDILSSSISQVLLDDLADCLFISSV